MTQDTIMDDTRKRRISVFDVDFAELERRALALILDDEATPVDLGGAWTSRLDDSPCQSHIEEISKGGAEPGIMKVTGPSCDCAACKEACTVVPGWFTPTEAIKALEAGYAKRMSAVREGAIWALAPSVVGEEGKETAFCRGRCNLLTQDARCEIHDSGFKPIECRAGYGCREASEYPEADVMRRLWFSPEGVRALELWLKLRAGTEKAKP